jgi:transposase InsO family protein/transposase-like protein
MFSQEERGRAVELYFSTDMTTQQVVDHLGYPTRQCLERWLHEDPRYSDAIAKPIVPLRKRVRAVRLCLAGMQQKRAAVQLGVSAGAVHHWMALYREGGMAALQPRRRIAVAKEEKPTIRPVPDDVGGLRRRVAELELENALMREVVEVVKKDPGASLGRLSNREKTRLIDRLRPMFSLSCLARRLAIPLSSYHYHHARGGRDKYSDIRMRVRTLFRDSSSRYGYRRIRHALRERISEKVVRRIMRQEGLVAHVPHRRRYSSYQGESTPAPENLIHRDFRAEGPNMKWLTDITEIKARDGKVYVSPMIDCYDGKIVAYTTGLHPNARLANTMLRKAIATLPDDTRVIVHSDRGCHYRWPEWIRICQKRGIIRSMSAKGCSPDNSAAEGFFGRMKTEAVYPEHWEQLTCRQVMEHVDTYMHWYNHQRIKQSLGWKSPVQYRKQQGLAA